MASHAISELFQSVDKYDRNIFSLSQLSIIRVRLNVIQTAVLVCQLQLSTAGDNFMKKGHLPPLYWIHASPRPRFQVIASQFQLIYL